MLNLTISSHILKKAAAFFYIHEIMQFGIFLRDVKEILTLQHLHLSIEIVIHAWKQHVTPQFFYSWFEPGYFYVYGIFPQLKVLMAAQTISSCQLNGHSNRNLLTITGNFRMVHCCHIMPWIRAFSLCDISDLVRVC